MDQSCNDCAKKFTSLSEDNVPRYHIFRSRLFGTQSPSRTVLGTVCLTLSCMRGMSNEGT